MSVDAINFSYEKTGPNHFFALIDIFGNKITIPFVSPAEL